MIFVAQYPWQLQDAARGGPSVKGKTPTQFADKTERRVATIGDITALVPRTMKVIVKNPGKPDPYAGMRFDQRFLLLLADLTPEQWKRAGGANGIGLREMNEAQRALFAGIWRSEAIQIREVRSDGQGYGSYTGVAESIPVSDIRFRLSRRVVLQIQQAGKGGASLHPVGSSDEQKGERQPDGSFLRKDVQLPDDFQDVHTRDSMIAFGVPVVVTVPNRLKTGQLPLDAPALSVPMRLDGSQDTLGKLLAAVGKATRTQFAADMRLANMPVGYRLAPGGQTVSTGDVLKALCRSVTGTFRRLDGRDGEAVYLLTDDVEGIGTRFARLDRWAEKAEQQRMEMDRKAIRDCAEKDPLSLLGFAPGDEYALPGDQLKTIDASYKSGGRGETFLPVSQLTPALREEFQREAERLRRSDTPVSVRTDTVGVSTEFECALILPGGRVFPVEFSGLLKFSFLEQIGVPKSLNTGARNPRSYKNPTPTPFPSALKRRVLTASLPETQEEIESLLAVLVKKGFTEIWWRVGASDAAMQERLRKAIEISEKSGVRVGAVIPWLLKDEPGAESVPDINILGETGDELVEIRMRNTADKNEAKKQRPGYSDRVAGWVVPETQNTDSLLERLAPFLEMSGLSAVMFTNTAPPGCGEFKNFGGDGYGITERMGYNAQARFRCVQQKGFDPVDVAGYTIHLGTGSELPFFRQFDMSQPLSEFRLAENTTHLARIYTAIRARFLQSPLYVDDRSNRDEILSFYGRWDKPDGLPALLGQYTVTEASQLRNTAFRAAPEPIFAIHAVRTSSNAAYFWNTWHDGMEEAAKGWGGFALHMPNDSLADITALLQMLPDTLAAPK